MVCHKCRTKARMDVLLEAHPDGNLPADETAPLIESCLVCSHGCRDAKGNSRCSVYARKVRIGRQVSALEQAESGSSSRLDGLRRQLSVLADECAKCGRTADDNPSHGGVSLVSIDAARGELPDLLGGDRDTAPSASSGSWLDTREVVQPENPDRATTLPLELEDRWRVELANFAGESLVNKLLVCFLMTRKSDGTFNTLADFARLRWLRTADADGALHDTELMRFIRSAGYDLVPRRPNPGLSKQAVHARYKSLVRRLPSLSAIARGRRTGRFTRRRAMI